MREAGPRGAGPVCPQCAESRLMTTELRTVRRTYCQNMTEKRSCDDIFLAGGVCITSSWRFAIVTVDSTFTNLRGNEAQLLFVAWWAATKNTWIHCCSHAIHLYICLFCHNTKDTFEKKWIALVQICIRLISFSDYSPLRSFWLVFYFYFFLHRKVLLIFCRHQDITVKLTFHFDCHNKNRHNNALICS